MQQKHQEASENEKPLSAENRENNEKLIKNKMKQIPFYNGIC